MTAFNKILTKLYNVPFYVKMLGLIIFSTVFIGTLTIFVIRLTFYKFNSSQLKELSASISRELSYQSVNYILENDMFGLTRVLQNAKKSNPDLLYAFIESPNKQIIASTFGDRFPIELLEVNNAFTQPSIERIKTNKGIIIDSSMPILGGKLGLLRVGISQKHSETVVGALVLYILFIILLSIFISFIFVSVIAYLVMRPIFLLKKATKDISNGNYNIRVYSPKYYDDLGGLIESFNFMIEKLNFLENERLKQGQLLKEFVNKIINAQEDERKRIARDLHDEFGQFFAYLKIRIKNIEDLFPNEKSKVIFEELKKHITKEVALIHDLVKNLRPIELDEMGLSKAIELYLHDLVIKENINIKFEFKTFNIENRRFDDHVEISIYRIIQEAVLNVIKHSKASFLKVFLEWDNGILRGIIEDNGVGFEAVEINSGFGIYGIKERIALLGGNIGINSDKENGTMIVFSIPA